MSGSTVTPWGAGMTDRAMGALMSHSSTLMTGHTATLAPPGSFKGARPTMGLYSALGLLMTPPCAY